MSQTYDPYRLASPAVYLVKIVIFLVLVVLVAAILANQLLIFFWANPFINSLILLTLFIGIILSFRQVMRLFPEINWVNALQEGRMPATQPHLLAPVLDSVGNRLDEAKDTSRYLTGLLVFLGLLGTFYGLLETVTHVASTIQALDATAGDTATLFSNLKEGLAAPLGGMGTAFSASLLGLSGSLILGFLDLQASQAQNAFYTDLEDWMTSMTELDHPVTQMQATGLGVSGDEMSAMLAQFGSTLQNSGSSQNAIRAMAELARGIDGLVKHIKAEQEDLRGHIIQQGETNKKLRELMEAMLREGESDRRPN
jgi:hypothetical protein